jgi:hypothetical protein
MYDPASPLGKKTEDCGRRFFSLSCSSDKAIEKLTILLIATKSDSSEARNNGFRNYAALDLGPR